MFRMDNKGPLGTACLLAGVAAIGCAVALAATAPAPAHDHHSTVGMGGFDMSAYRNETVGDTTSGTVDPDRYLTELAPSRTETQPDGSTLRIFEIHAINKEIEIAPGVFFPAWTYNGQVPGPTLRARTG